MRYAGGHRTSPLTNFQIEIRDNTKQTQHTKFYASRVTNKLIKRG